MGLTLGWVAAVLAGFSRDLTVPLTQAVVGPLTKDLTVPLTQAVDGPHTRLGGGCADWLDIHLDL